MALVPHKTDPKRDEVMAKIGKQLKGNKVSDADALLGEHNIKVGKNDQKVVAPTEGVLAKSK